MNSFSLLKCAGLNAEQRRSQSRREGEAYTDYCENLSAMWEDERQTAAMAPQLARDQMLSHNSDDVEGVPASTIVAGVALGDGDGSGEQNTCEHGGADDHGSQSGSGHHGVQSMYNNRLLATGLVIGQLPAASVANAGEDSREEDGEVEGEEERRGRATSRGLTVSLVEDDDTI